MQVRTTCPYCGVGCGVLANVEDDGKVSVKGDKQHPANYGRLCSKGAALAQTLDLEDRLLTSQLNGKEVGWNEALDAVANGFKRTIEQYGRDAVAFYVSGQLLTEDYYVANKLMKGFIGSANIDTNSRLCMSSAVAGHKRAFGADTVPGCYEDFELADLVVLVGSNTAWCHPVLFQRIMAAKKQRPDMRIVVIDPRETATCEIADLHLPVKPGTDIRLFNLLLTLLAARQRLDQDYIDQHTEGFEESISAAMQDAQGIEATADYCQLPTDKLKNFLDWFIETEKTVTLFSQGVNQSSYGTDKVNAIINCHLASGRIGRPGMGPFSMTGQPNAMGGREVGALANQLAHHIEFDEEGIATLGRFWGSDNIATTPGLKAVDLFQRIEAGEVKAVWIMATNPVVSMPNADQVKRALADCELVVVSDCMAATDTMAYADVALPALAWGEKSGTVTNSERRISRQRQFLAHPGEARPDWWIVKEVAGRMGYDGFDYQQEVDIFREVASLSGHENKGRRDFDISGMQAISANDYEELTPFQWPRVKGVASRDRRFFSRGGFYTPSRKANFIAVQNGQPGQPVNSQYPYILNTGRVRDQWHTMTRTGKSARLNQHISEPFVAIHPQDAERENIRDHELVRVSSRHGAITVRANVTAEQRPGQVFVPMHWNAQYSADARMGAVVNDFVDPYSGQPEFKHTPVILKRYAVDWGAFIYSRTRLSLDGIDYWTASRLDGYWHYELAGSGDVTDVYDGLMQQLHGNNDANSPQWLQYQDSGTRTFRSALVEDGRINACLFMQTPEQLPSREWLQSLFELESLTPEQRSWLLSGQSPPGTVEQGAIVCSCFSVGESRILEAIANGASSVEALGEQLQCGTNCGSCIPELKSLLEQHAEAVDEQADDIRLSAVAS